MIELTILNPDAPPVCLDPRQTVIAQYANSPKLLSTIDHFDQALNLSAFFNQFYMQIWNIETANGQGLNIWGIIVGVNRTIKTFTGFFWGFNEETLLLARPYHDSTGFNDGLTDATDRRTALGMFRDEQELQGEVTFDDTNFRKLILSKAYANISDYTISDLNTGLMMLFGDKLKHHEIYVRDNHNMTLTLVLNWIPNSDEVALIMNSGMLFRPAGVRYDVAIEGIG